MIVYLTYDPATDAFRPKCMEMDDVEEADRLIPADHVAKAVYRNLINATGWAFLELQTNAAAEDGLQARAAGVLEGYVTARVLHMHVHNVARSDKNNVITKRFPMCSYVVLMCLA